MNAEKLSKLESSVSKARKIDTLWNSRPTDFENRATDEQRDRILSQFIKLRRELKAELNSIGLGCQFGMRIVDALAICNSPTALELQNLIESGNVLKIRNFGLKSYLTLLEWLECPKPDLPKKAKKLICPYCGERTWHHCDKVP